MFTKINNYELRTISLFTRYNFQYYIREVQKLLSVSSRTALITLQTLESKGVLSSKTIGKIRMYKLASATEYLHLSEIYKKIQFSNELIKETINKFSKSVNGVLILFGSHAKGLAKKDSDIDLLIIGDYKKVPIFKEYGLDASIKKVSKEDFIKLKNSDSLLIEVLKDHIIFKGVEEFIELVWEN